MSIRSHVTLDKDMREKANQLKSFYALPSFSAVVCFALNELYKRMQEELKK